MREEVLPVCAPDLRQSTNDPGWLRTAPLLHLDTRPDAWERWFAVHGLAAPGLRGMLFDQFSTMIPAVANGLGVALLPSYLVEYDLARGRLVTAHDGPAISLGSYYLVWPKERMIAPPLDSFRVWLQEAFT